MVVESFGCGLCGGTHSNAVRRDRGRKAQAMVGDLFLCKRSSAPTILMPAAKIVRIGVNDEEGLKEISGCRQFHSRHLGWPFSRRPRDRADGREHHGFADVPGIRSTYRPRPRNLAPGRPYRQVVGTIQLCKRTLVRLVQP